MVGVGLMKFLTSLPVLAILLVPQAGIGDRFQTSAKYGNDCQRWAAWNYNAALDQCRLLDGAAQRACQAIARDAHQQALEDCGARRGHSD